MGFSTLMQVVCTSTELLTGENIANDARCNFSRALLLPSLSVFEVIYGAGNSWTIRVLLRPFLDLIRGGRPDATLHSVWHGEPRAKPSGGIQESLIIFSAWINELE